MTASPSLPQVIIDTDPGIDDAAALLFAFGLENLGFFKILGITAVAGNVPLSLTQKNARIIADWGGRQDLPIYAGMREPILKDGICAADVHGETGLGEGLLPDPKTPLQKENAVEFLVAALKKAPPRSLTLIALGPLTNLALALKIYPEGVRAIAQILIMGGNYFNPGNITPNAEFNFFVDPVAAKIILKQPSALKIFPLDVTHKACITNARMEQLRALPNANGKRVADLLQSYSRYDIQTFGLEGGPLHDPCPIAYLADPALFSGKKVYATIETAPGIMEGAVQVDWHDKLGQKANVEWFNNINADLFFELLTRALATLP